MKTHNQLITTTTNRPDSHPLSHLMMEIADRILSPTATLQEIVALIKSDRGLTARVLKLVNSSYYAIPGGVTDIARALEYVGYTSLALIIFTSTGFLEMTGLSRLPGLAKPVPSAFVH